MNSAQSETERTVRKYGDTVYKVAFSYTRNKSDADDIFQEVFLRLIKSNPSFESEEHKKAWLIRTAINCSKKHFTSAFIRHTVPLSSDIPFETPEESSIDEALKKLKPKYRTVIHLYYYEEYSTEEIAELLGEKPSAVRTRLTRARKSLGELLKGE